MPRLALKNVAQRLPLAFIQLSAVQSLKNLLGDAFACRCIEQTIVTLDDLDLTVDQPDQGAVNNRLAKLFDQVERETRLAGTVGVEKPGMRIKPGQDQSGAHLRLQDAIPIIEVTTYPFYPE